MFSILRAERCALSYPLILYALVLFVLFNIKPSFSFNNDGSLKEWGIGNDKTMFPVFIIAMIICVPALFLMTIMYS